MAGAGKLILGSGSDLAFAKKEGERKFEKSSGDNKTKELRQKKCDNKKEREEKFEDFLFPPVLS